MHCTLQNHITKIKQAYWFLAFIVIQVAHILIYRMTSIATLLTRFIVTSWMFPLIYVSVAEKFCFHEEENLDDCLVGVSRITI